MTTTARRAWIVGATVTVLTALGLGLAVVVGNIDVPADTMPAADVSTDRMGRNLAMSWAARILLGVALLWLVWGMLSRRTRTAHWPGAAGARADWLAGTRPWRAFESTLGLRPLDRVLLVVVPATLLVLSRGIQTSFLAPVHTLIVFGSWLLFCVVLAVALRGRSPWPVISAMGGAIVLRVVVLLAAVAIIDPGGPAFEFSTGSLGRTVYITIAFGLFVWVLIAAGWALSGQFGVRRAWGVVLAGAGTVLSAVGCTATLIGFETVLAAWNDQIGLLPGGLDRILGITAYLDSPADAAWLAAVAGLVLLALGVLLAQPARRFARPGSRG